MIIPVSPVPVRIALETQSINNGGYVVHDIDVAELIEKADSAQYELQLCYGTTSLYRSAVYQINKTAKTITFFFMVGQDLFTAALTANNRCTFAKMSAGMSGGEVRNLITSSANAGLSQNLLNVDYTAGCTITMAYADVNIIAAGHLVVYERGNAYSTSNVYETDFFHTPGTNQWRYKDSSGDFDLSTLTRDTLKTGIHITNVDSSEFDAFVTWYYNPDGCYLAEGQYIPDV